MKLAYEAYTYVINMVQQIVETIVIIKYFLNRTRLLANI